MRTLEYGKFAAEYTNIVGRYINGRSIIVDGCSTNAALDQGAAGDWVYLYGSDAATWTKLLVKVVLDTIRSLIGHTPVILSGEWRYALDDYSPGTSYTVDAYRMRLSPDYTDATYRYRDVTGSVTWYLDAYSPVPGQDIDSTPFDTQTVTAPLTDPSTWNQAVDVTQPLLDALRRGTDLEFLFWRQGSATRMDIFWSAFGSVKRPYLRVRYLFPLEFFQATSGGDIALGSMVNNYTEENLFYLGAYERGETGSPVKGYVKNFSARTLDLIEIIDDHPEWSDPVQTAGAGTGSLDFVWLADTADSQKYTVKFSSGSAFEVKAEAYRDNITGDHPSFDATPAWQGTTASDWTSPTGDLTIAVEGWQPGTAVNDEFEFYVRGNSSDESWASDSASQIQITRDSGGSPDAAEWRPINGRRVKTTAAVTIDATTKKFPCKAIDSALWIVGDRGFIGDGTNLHEGTVASAQEAEIGADTFTGSGLNDITIAGNYNGTWEDTLRVKIDGTGTPDTFTWSIDGGSTWEATGVNCSTSAVALADGITVLWAANTGHTLNDYWEAAVQPFAVELESLTNDSTVYAIGSRVGTSLPIESLGPAVWGITTAAAGASETPANRIYLQGPPPDDDNPTDAGFVMGQEVYVVDITNPDAAEYADISSVAGTYIDLTSNLTEDYPEGSLVMVRDSGEAAFWLRAVASAGTTEELKQARLNVRV